MTNPWPMDLNSRVATVVVRRTAVAAMDRLRSAHDSSDVLMVQAWTCSTVRLCALCLGKEEAAGTSLCNGSSIANTAAALASGTADVRATEIVFSLWMNVKASA